MNWYKSLVFFFVLLLFACHEKTQEKLVFHLDDDNLCMVDRKNESASYLGVNVEFDTLRSNSPINEATVKVKNHYKDKAIILKKMEFLDQIAHRTRMQRGYGNIEESYIHRPVKKELFDLNNVNQRTGPQPGDGNNPNGPQGNTGPSGNIGPQYASYFFFIRPQEEIEISLQLRVDHNLCLEVDWQELDTIDFESRLYIERVPFSMSEKMKDFSKRIKTVMIDDLEVDTTYHSTIKMKLLETDLGFVNYSMNTSIVKVPVKKHFGRELKNESIVFGSDQYCIELAENLYVIYDKDERALLYKNGRFFHSRYEVLSRINAKTLEHLELQLLNKDFIWVKIDKEIARAKGYEELTSFGDYKKYRSYKGGPYRANKIPIDEVAKLLQVAKEKGLALVLKEYRAYNLEILEFEAERK